MLCTKFEPLCAAFFSRGYEGSLGKETSKDEEKLVGISTKAKSDEGKDRQINKEVRAGGQPGKSQSKFGLYCFYFPSCL